MQELPYYANCVTAVRFLIEKINMTLPYEWIGDLPREAVFRKGWRIELIPSAELCFGDLLFVRNRYQHRKITHIALVMNKTSVFHCSQEGAKAESLESFFARFEQGCATPSSLLLNRDERSLSYLRKFNSKSI